MSLIENDRIIIDIHSSPPQGSTVEELLFRNRWADETIPIDPAGRTVEDIARDLSDEALGLRISEGDESVTVFRAGVLIRKPEDFLTPLEVLAKRPAGPIDFDGGFELQVGQRIGATIVFRRLQPDDVVIPPVFSSKGGIKK